MDGNIFGFNKAKLAVTIEESSIIIASSNYTLNNHELLMPP